MTLLQNFIQLFIESAPWLVLGFTIAGLIKSFVPTDFLTRHLGGRGPWTTIKAAFIGAPLPLCSCGVVPAALGLRKSGASKNATVSFLVATPETGVDSVSVTYALLGPMMAIIRPIAAISSGILAGLLVGRVESTGNAGSENNEKPCCRKETPISPDSSASNRLVAGLKFSFVDMIRDIAPWLVLGLVFAAAVTTWVPASFLAQWGSGWLAFTVMVLIGIPMYICATASTPIAAGLLLAGVSPGAVLVFMLAGPATNIGTLGIVGKELGKRALLAYLSGVIIVSFAFGFLTNFLTDQFAYDFLPEAMAAHSMEHPWWAYASALLLTTAIVYALGGKLIKRRSTTPQSIVNQ